MPAATANIPAVGAKRLAVGTSTSSDERRSSLAFAASPMKALSVFESSARRNNVFPG